MPRTGRGIRRSARASGAPSASSTPPPNRTVSVSGSLTRQPTASPRDLLAHICDTPHLARAVSRLPPRLLYGVIQRCGLEDCGELLALATTEQLSAVFDLDLWRVDRAGRPGRPDEERFDAERFGGWLDVLADHDVEAAAQRLAGLDAELVVAGLAAQIAVFDPGVLPTAEQLAESDGAIPNPAERGLHAEIGGYIVVARRTDSWDTIVAVLVALSQEHPMCFHRVMRGCRRLSNSKPEIDGLHDLLADEDQGLFDLTVDRERRRESQGYVTPPQARAFLESSRRLSLDAGAPPPAGPIVTAYLRGVAWSAEQADVHPPPSDSGAAAAADAQAREVAEVVGALVDAGMLPKQPLALLAGSSEDATRFPSLTLLMHFVNEHEPGASSLRSQELGFLANVLLAGCSVQGRALTAAEAFAAAAATCNLGLEHWPRQWLAPRARQHGAGPAALPESFLAGQDLPAVFRVGWAVLHRRVSMRTAERLLDAIAHLECHDQDVRFDLYVLRREMTRHWQAGTPWHARKALEVIAMLDMPAWAALDALLDEIPVVLAHVGGPAAPGAPAARSISLSAFEFIAAERQIASVHAYLRLLPDLLSH